MRAARTATTLLVAGALALGAGACGGSDDSYREVPGPPAAVPVPDDTSTLGEGDADTGDDPSATPTPDAAATPEAGTTAPSDQTGAVDPGADPAAGTGTGTGGTDAAGTDSGGAPAPAEEDGPATDAPPPPGSDAQEFEDFCAQNPGAC